MPRRFSEEEAQRIFALVAERQRSGLGTDAGLSLAELEEAARAAGLDPSLVAGAAAELDAAPHPERTVAGAPVEVVRTRVVASPLDDETWEGLVQTMRSEFGEVGIAGQVGRLREWTCMTGNGTNHSTVTRLAAEPTADGTRITVSRSVRDVVLGFSMAAAIQWTMSVIFVGLFLGGVDPEMWIPALILAVLGTGFGAGAQIGARVWHRSQTARFERLLDRMELVARDTGPPIPSRSPRLDDSAEADRIDPALLDDEPAPEATDRPRGRDRA